jgi:hypothetical protein
MKDYVERFFELLGLQNQKIDRFAVVHNLENTNSVVYALSPESLADYIAEKAAASSLLNFTIDAGIKVYSGLVAVVADLLFNYLSRENPEFDSKEIVNARTIDYVKGVIDTLENSTDFADIEKLHAGGLELAVI